MRTLQEKQQTLIQSYERKKRLHKQKHTVLFQYSTYHLTPGLLKPKYIYPLKVCPKMKKNPFQNSNWFSQDQTSKFRTKWRKYSPISKFPNLAWIKFAAPLSTHSQSLMRDTGLAEVCITAAGQTVGLYRPTEPNSNSCSNGLRLHRLMSLLCSGAHRKGRAVPVWTLVGLSTRPFCISQQNSGVSSCQHASCQMLQPWTKDSC